ncbi:MAG TPA: bifunctional pyr operon transcriptional regulator/uracil phosphoribosyltransferase PyrR [Rhodothermales bacterium]|nr:bifunctional pyr operon transcriptional regulator/uracil phosphoribosyltransferase PyrR [Rhodothermales bacterium]
MGKTLILSAPRVQRTLNRMAYEIMERNRGAENLELVGIRSRGTALAEALAKQISAVEPRQFHVSKLDVAPYRDDRDTGVPVEDQSVVPVDLADRDVILVDDVLFTGRTARAALDGIVYYGRPRSVQLAILVDRGHREYPIQPDFTGRVIPTKHRERVVVSVDQGFSIFIVE